MDTISREHRSWNMSRIRSKDTRPEIQVRSILHRMGFRFRTSTGRKLAGRPDVVLPCHRTAVFVHGCFWHRHAGCQFAYTPKSRIDFWLGKFAENVERDRRARRSLVKDGWKVVTIWECELRHPEKLIKRLGRVIKSTDCRINRERQQ